MERQGDKELLIVRAFNAPMGLVFDAYTQPRLLKRWLLGPPGWTMVQCEVDLKVGGSYRYVLQDPQGNTMGWGGKFLEVDEPNRYVHTELFDQDWTGGETTITVEFVEVDGVTTVTQTVVYSSGEAREMALKTPMEDGMAESLNNLDAVLSEELP